MCKSDRQDLCIQCHGCLTALVLFAASIQFTGCGNVTIRPTITSIAVSCSSPSLLADQTAKCSAVVTGTGSYSNAVTWAVSPSTIGKVNDGTFTPASVGTAMITATSTQDTSKSGSASVAVVSITSVVITCSPSPILATQTSQCTASVTGAGPYSTTVSWSTTGGSITSAGVFTPSATGTLTITATSTQDTTKSGSVNVGVGTITSVAATCSPASIWKTQTAQCTASVNGTGIYNDTVTWSATGGKISSTGIFTPSSGGAATVTATSVADPTQSGSAPLKVSSWKSLYPMSGGNIPNLVVDRGQTAYATPLRVGRPGATPGDVGSILKSIDFGVTWTRGDGDLPAPVSGPFVADPVTPGVLYAGTSLGLYKTLDGGTHWSKLPLNLPGVDFAQGIAIAPTNPSRIYVATRGDYVQRSTDRGQTWSQSSANLSAPNVSAIAVSPTNELVAYASTQGGLFKTNDGGDHWFPIGSTGGHNIYVAPSDPNVLYLIGATITKSIDAGATWTDAGRPDGVENDVAQLQILPSDPNTVYAATSAGLFGTITGGGAWIPLGTPPNNGSFYLLSVALDPARSILYIGSQYSGVSRSTDGGVTWQQANNGVFNVEFAGLDVCSSDPTRVYGAASGGIPIGTTDGGATWSKIAAAETTSPQVLLALACSPADSSHLLVGTENYAGPLHTQGVGNIWMTDDGGLTFNAASVNLGIPGYSLYPGSFGFNPKDPFLVNSSLQDYQGGFLYSVDGGSSWNQPDWTYMYPGEYTYHPTLSNIVFTTTNEYFSSDWDYLYVAYSADFGAHWQPSQVLGDGQLPLEGSFAKTVALDQADPTILYTAGIFFGEGTRGVYKFKIAYTGDQVTSVSRIPGTFNTGLTSPDVNQLLYNAATGYLYAATGSGVFRSNDGAATWTSLNGDLQYMDVSRISISSDGQHLYAGTNAGIYELDVP